MKLRLKPLERSIRERVREEIKASPGLMEEYLRRRSSYVPELLGAILQFVLLAIGFAVMPVLVSGAMVVRDVLRLEIGQASWAPTPDSVLLAMHALYLTGVVLVASLPQGDLDRRARAVLVFPVSDLSLNRRWRGLFVLTLWPTPVYVYIAWRSQFSLAGWLGIALVAALQPVVSIATALWIADRTRSPPRSPEMRLLASCSRTVRFSGSPSWVFQWNCYRRPRRSC